MDYSHLQNGSDIRGVAMPGVPGEDVNLSEDAVRHIARGFAAWLRQRTGAGVCVTDMGLCTTPAMFMTTVTEGYRYDGAVMITASHLPWNRNGLKFFTAAGGAESSDIRAILAGGVAPAGEFAPGRVEHGEFLETYAAILRDKITAAAGREKPLTGYKIVVDAGNGAGGFFADRVLAALGADVTGSVFLEPDGRFPNHVPNPELPEAEEKVLFGGRLGEYKYYDMDQVIAAALAEAENELAN